MTEAAIKVDNVSKRFKLYPNPITGPIKEILFFWKHRQFYKEFLAIKEVSFEIKKGEVVGIIGANGAGKTTLLKMIAGLLPIDKGVIQIKGKITALLALGVGTNPEFTGRENIFYGGLLLGMTKKEIVAKMPSIIDFTELGEYIDRPFRTYSSGMKARLLFATAMSIDADILIVDEALSTGDYAFVDKSMRRIREICQSGTTILFVSHNLTQIQQLCTRVVVLHRGIVVYDGDPKTAVSKYVDVLYASSAKDIVQINSQRLVQKAFRGTGEIQVDDIYFMSQGQKTETLFIGKSCELHIEYVASRDIQEASLCLEVFSVKASIPYAFVPPPDLVIENIRLQNRFDFKKGKGKVIMSFSPLVVGDGRYVCDFECYPSENAYKFSYETCYCYYRAIVGFQAVYEDTRIFGRGTLSEIPVKSIAIEERRSN